MKKFAIVLIAMFAVIATNGQLQIKASGVKWDENYSFDKCNVFQVEAFAKNNELMKTMHFKTYYQTGGENGFFEKRGKLHNQSERRADEYCH